MPVSEDAELQGPAIPICSQFRNALRLHLIAVQMLSRTEGWAVGGGLIAHYHDGTWTRIEVAVAYPGPSGNPNIAELRSVSMVSADEGWAVGFNDGSGRPPNPGAALMLHYHGGQWSRVAGPENASLSSVSMVSADEGWAVGTQLHQATPSSPITFEQLLLHYTGGAWSKAELPPLDIPAGTVNLESISMSPMGTGCAQGWSSPPPKNHTDLRLLHSFMLCSSGGRWQQVALPPMPDSATATIFCLVALPNAEIWAAGETANSSTGLPQPRALLMRYDGGTWVVYAN